MVRGSHASSTKRMQSRDNMSSENAYEITKLVLIKIKHYTKNFMVLVLVMIKLYLM
jgi:hypothetical protein